jgi:MerR family glutamine synthetase transcriptional repressor
MDGGGDAGKEGVGVPFEVQDDTPVYTIGRVVEMTGLSARQVRYYEKKSLLNPARTTGNQRLYSRDEVHLLQLVRRLLDEGYTLANIQRMVRERRRPEEPRLEDYPSREGLHREERSSLYPLVNRAKLLEVLDRLEQRDLARQRQRATKP